MTFPFGVPVRLTTEVRDPSKILTDPASITVTVLLPDGTVTAPAAGVRDDVGRFHYDFVSTQAGHHIARWDAVTPTGADEEPFDVDAQWGESGIVSLAEVKAHLNMSPVSSTNDPELQGFIGAAGTIVERYVGPVIRRVWTEDLDGGSEAVALNHAPVLLIATVTESGTVVDASGYTLHSRSGVLRRRHGYVGYLWARGIGNVTVTYTAGRAVVDPAWTRAALILVAHMWDTQRAGHAAAGSRPQPGGVEAAPMASAATYSIPRRALELLGEPMPGIA